MLIDGLPSLNTPASGDEIPIERGTDTYKIDYANLFKGDINSTGNFIAAHLKAKSGSRYIDIQMLDSNNVPRGFIYTDGQTGRIFFRSINPNVASGDVGSYYTEYYLYQSSLTDSSVSYKIYTERDTIPVDHGGTGATSAAAARTNLGVELHELVLTSQTVDANGNINTNLNVGTRVVVSARCSAYIVTPWVSGATTTWWVHLTTYTGADVSDGTSVGTVRVYYYDL